MRHLEPLELKALLEKPPPGTQLLDVRLPEEHEIVRIPGCILIPMHEIPQRMGELRRDRPVVVYCHHGVRSMQVAAYLERAGFTEVSNLDGGIDAYADEADPTLGHY